MAIVVAVPTFELDGKKYTDVTVLVDAVMKEQSPVKGELFLPFWCTLNVDTVMHQTLQREPHTSLVVSLEANGRSLLVCVIFRMEVQASSRHTRVRFLLSVVRTERCRPSLK